MRDFDLIITGDDTIKGKPGPQSFTTALKKTNLDIKDALVVENSPLGVMSA
jgi:beta-phosphoglucomutase-like phosphatase (HAD superfamily)